MTESILRKTAVKRVVESIDDNVPRKQKLRLIMDELHTQVNKLLDEMGIEDPRDFKPENLWENRDKKQTDIIDFLYKNYKPLIDLGLLTLPVLKDLDRPAYDFLIKHHRASAAELQPNDIFLPGQNDEIAARHEPYLFEQEGYNAVSAHMYHENKKKKREKTQESSE